MGTQERRPERDFPRARLSFALLRPIIDATAQDKLRDIILEAFKEHEAEMAVAS